MDDPCFICVPSSPGSASGQSADLSSPFGASPSLPPEPPQNAKPDPDWYRSASCRNVPTGDEFPLLTVFTRAGCVCVGAKPAWTGGSHGPGDGSRLWVQGDDENGKLASAGGALEEAPVAILVKACHDAGSHRKFEIVPRQRAHTSSVPIKLWRQTQPPRLHGDSQRLPRELPTQLHPCSLSDDEGRRSRLSPVAFPILCMTKPDEISSRCSVHTSAQGPATRLR
jgi:hypothetical protein